MNSPWKVLLNQCLLYQSINVPEKSCLNIEDEIRQQLCYNETHSTPLKWKGELVISLKDHKTRFQLRYSCNASPSSSASHTSSSLTLPLHLMSEQTLTTIYPIPLTLSHLLHHQSNSMYLKHSIPL